MENNMERAIERAAQLVRDSSKIVVFSGAGISTESGIPDFRSPGGIWSRYAPVEFGEFLASREARERYWIRSRETYPTLAQAQPNPAHLAIAELERWGKLDCVITQNVDGLHQKAGNSPEKVIEIHGSTHWVECLNCSHWSPRSQWQQVLESGVTIPECPDCGGILKVNTVSFGQPMPERETRRAEKRSKQCDLFIAIGSTLVVYPAAQMPVYAVNAGARLVIVNLTPTYIDDQADALIREKAGLALTRILELARQG
ncbi:MAG: SIR2 family NAD-dependent protein deacylase [Chloroflexota bacterium]|jgi:NAD-dependent deacetylase